MKKFQKIVGLMCLITLPMLQACSDDEGHSLGEIGGSWATIKLAKSVKADGGYAPFYLQSDDYGSLWLVNTDLGFYKPVDGQRVIAFYNPLYDNFEGYDHAVKLIDMREALTKEMDELTDENEEQLGNDPILIYQGDMGFSGGYMNLIFFQDLPKDLNTKHRISLVEVKPETDDGYVHLKLLYNTYDDTSGRYTPAFVSFNLSKLTIPDNSKGFKVQLNSEKNGEVEVEFSKQSENKTISAISELEYSKMQLE
ncbi:MAG: NigD-like protein [Prevotellaceae bacterium]|jgi:hypothetical protein|nr:NigD-like protein [Prevotellaceae bacterium]